MTTITNEELMKLIENYANEQGYTVKNAFFEDDIWHKTMVTLEVVESDLKIKNSKVKEEEQCQSSNKPF